VQEDVIDQEASNRGLGPLRPPTRSKLLAGLPPGQESSKAHPRRQRTHCDLAATPHARVSEDPPAAASVLEVDASEPDPRFARKSHQDQLDILLEDMVIAVTTRGAHAEADLPELRIRRHEAMVIELDGIIRQIGHTKAYHSTGTGPHALIEIEGLQRD